MPRLPPSCGFAPSAYVLAGSVAGMRPRLLPARVALPLVALIGLALLAVAGCSSSDDEAADATTTTEAAPTTTEATGPLERYADYEPDVYADLANWVCHPEADDVCDDGLDATVVEADGRTETEPWTPDPDAPIDCFYVYPTISADPGGTSDRVPGDEERFVTLNQAARLGEVCRVFAPVYRQRTLAGLAGALAGSATTTTTVAGQPPAPSPGYVDVLDAFRTYMANENEGRGVVLIGHSQGAGVLNQLIREEIDPNADVRDHLVAAYLAGSSLRVPDGQDVGGDFAEVPLCREETQTGCAVSWAAFRSDAPPPPNALFGRPRTGEGVAACNSPASLAGGSAALRSYFPSDPNASILSSLGVGGRSGGEPVPWVEGQAIETPFVTTPGLVAGECVSRDGFNYLEVTVNADADDPRIDDIGGDLTPEWGLHLQDLNLVMGDVVSLVGSQSEAWRSARD